MPALFGAVGLDQPAADSLEREFATAFGALETRRTQEWLLGGHAHGGHRAIRQCERGWFAVDGEVEASERTPFELSSGWLELQPAARGVIALLEEDGGVHVACDWLNSVPVYYASHRGGFAFSSHMRPLARSLGCAPDPVGLMEYLREAAFPSERTALQGVFRLLPGQSLRFRAGEGVTVSETSRLWTHDPIGSRAADPADAAELLWSRLLEALARLEGARRPALMLSAGWDSRTLIAGLREVGHRDVLAYTHGHPRAREIRLVRRLARVAGVRLEVASLDAGLLRMNDLEDTFARSENLVFLHWTQAGRRLKSLGANVVMAGVLGEILGGHYGSTMIRTGPGRFLDLGRRMLGRSSPSSKQARAIDLLGPSFAELPWYANKHAWPGVADLAAGMRADIERDLSRLRGRGVPEGDQLVEAYQTETRGCQHICSQLDAARSYLPATAPFADRSLAEAATCLPLETKIHNRLSRAMLARHAPDLLRLPLAATLARADRPLIFQEISRAARWGIETAHWAVYRKAGGRLPAPRWGWVDFAFLRAGTLRTLAEQLRSSLWDMDAIESAVNWIEGPEGLRNVHPWYDQFGKMLTIDFLLRSP